MGEEAETVKSFEVTTHAGSIQSIWLICNGLIINPLSFRGKLSKLFAGMCHSEEFQQVLTHLTMAKSSAGTHHQGMTWHVPFYNIIANVCQKREASKPLSPCCHRPAFF